MALALAMPVAGFAVPHSWNVSYRNSEYGLVFQMPKDWSGYSARSEWVEDNEFSEKAGREVVVDRMVLITLQHPPAKHGRKWQEIPILVFTTAQWDALNHGKLWPSDYAGGVIDELWHNPNYVFALHSRYNWDESVQGIKEVETIIDQNCATHPGNKLYEP